MRNIIAFPLLALTVILQSAIVSHVQLLSGYADLPLVLLSVWALQKRVKSAWHWGALTCLFVGFISRMPILVVVASYFGAVFFAQLLQKRVWQAPLLAAFSVVFAAVLFSQALSFLALRFLGVPLPLKDVVGLIVLPSLLLNILLTIPLYALMRDLSHWVYPSEE